MRLYVCVLLSVFVLIFPISAASLTLAEALREAQSQSPMILKAKASVSESDGHVEDVRGTGFYPKFSATTTHFFDQKFQEIDVPLNGTTLTFPTIYPTTVYGVRASLPLFDGFSNVAKLESAQWSQKASQQDLAQVSFQLDESIALAFYQALTAQKLEEVTAHHVTVLQEHFKQVQIQKKAGTVTNYDVLRIQVQLSEAELDAAEARDRVAISRQSLCQLMGVLEDDRVLEGQLPTPDLTLIETLSFDDTLNSRSDIKSLDFRQKSLQKTQEADMPWYMPKIAAIGSYDLYNNIDGTVAGSSFRAAYQTGVVLNWDLFDGNVAHAKSEVTRAQREQIDHAIEESKLRAYSDFDKWKKMYKSSVLRFQIKQLDGQRSEESVRLARLEAKAGTRTNTEVLDAELDLFRSKAGTVMAQMQAVEAFIKLEIALGRRL